MEIIQSFKQGLYHIDKSLSVFDQINQLFPNVLGEADRTQIEEEFKIYEKLTESFDLTRAKLMSLDEREKLPQDQITSELTYGEVDHQSIVTIIRLCKAKYNLQEGGVFCDLGHGTGKAMLAAALTGYFRKVQGVELLKDLCKESENLKLGYQFYCQQRKVDSIPFEAICGDWFEVDWSQADFVLINSTCFKEAIW
jgi:hypothetical protein